MLHISQQPEADKLLSENPLALVVGMVMDQQVPMERAFRAPLELEQRLGADLDAGRIAAMDPEDLRRAFAGPPALHRYPGSMAKRVQELCRELARNHHGDPASVWEEARSGEELVARLTALPGFGDDKARKFAALLGKQLGVRPAGWRASTEPFGEPEVFRSVADVRSREDLDRVRAYKRSLKSGPGRAR